MLACLVLILDPPAIGTKMNTINKRLEEVLFGEHHYYIHPHLYIYIYLRSNFSAKVIKKLDNLYIDWEYSNSVLEMI